MYVCICKNITDSDIKKAIKNGAQNLHQVREELPLGGQCGKCLPLARDIIQKELGKQEESPLLPAFGLFSPKESTS